MSATDFDRDFIEDWGVFEDTKNINEEISQNSFATDQSPVDVERFPTVARRRPSKSDRYRKEGADGPKQRRSVTSNRLPRKSRSLEGSGKAAVVAFAAQNGPGTHDRRRSSMRRTKSEGLRRKSLANALREEEAEEEFPERRRRTSGRRSQRHGQANSTAIRESERRGSSRQCFEKDDSSSRLDRMKELGNAFRAATILEKSFVPRTEHLKKDILM